MSRRLYAVCWSWKQHAIVRTKKEGKDKMRQWKLDYEAMGWTVRSSGPDAYIATGPGDQRHAIALHEYDPETKERIYTPLVRPKRKESESVKSLQNAA